MCTPETNSAMWRPCDSESDFAYILVFHTFHEHPGAYQNAPCGMPYRPKHSPTICYSPKFSQTFLS
jgi:hypothetical protein